MIQICTNQSWPWKCFKWCLFFKISNPNSDPKSKGLPQSLMFLNSQDPPPPQKKALTGQTSLSCSRKNISFDSVCFLVRKRLQKNWIRSCYKLLTPSIHSCLNCPPKMNRTDIMDVWVDQNSWIAMSWIASHAVPIILRNERKNNSHAKDAEPLQT